jgi:uncharacterized protein with PIN domain
VLTRDRALLMQRDISHGCYVRAERPLAQAEEIVLRLDLFGALDWFTRCLVCNTPLTALALEEAVRRVPRNTAKHYRDFKTCQACDRVYWLGSHTRRLAAVLQAALRRRDDSSRSN